MHNNFKHELSEFEWLLIHHKAKEKERQQIVKDLAFSSSECVLDLACGPGLWTQLIAKELLPDGRIIGVDIDHTLLTYARDHVQNTQLFEIIEFCTGSMYEIPCNENSFDHVFLSNALLYVPESDHTSVINEMKRVTKPGGRIVVKDIDGVYLVIHPIDPNFLLHIVSAATRGLQTARAVSHFDNFMGRKLHGVLQQAGVKQVMTRTYAIQKASPLSDVEKHYILRSAGWILEKARPYLSEAEAAKWRNLFTPGMPECIINRNEFYYCMLEILSIGRVHKSSH